MPFSVWLCSLKDPEANFFIQTAVRGGHIPYEKDHSVYIDIFTEGNTWRAPDAVFKRIPSGTYQFRTEGNKVQLVKVS